MANFGFVKVAAAVPSVKVSDCEENAREIIRIIGQAEAGGTQVVVFPELSLTGYTCGDLLLNDFLQKEACQALLSVADATRGKDVIAIVGLPVSFEGTLLNAAAVVHGGRVLAFVPKIFLPNYKEFYEMRWFSSGAGKRGTVTLGGQKIPLGANLLFRTPETTFAVEICEDLWATIPPSSQQTLRGAEIVFNLSADDELVGNRRYVQSLVSQQSARCLCGYVFAACGFGESTTDVVFAGNGTICENGSLLAESAPFSTEAQMVTADIDVEFLRSERMTNKTFGESIRTVLPQENDFEIIEIQQNIKENTRLDRHVDASPFIPHNDAQKDASCTEIFSIQTLGFAKRMAHTHAQTAVVGISGGLDSTLALLVSVNTFDTLRLDRKNIIGVTMPGFGTTDRTYQNALNMMRSLGVTVREISIKDACIQHFKDINHPENTFDVTYENSQARERTQILMDIANQTNGLVVGTGDLSELALGWATYNGDHMSMYAVNAGVPKTLIRHLVGWYAQKCADAGLARTLLNVLDTPVSPELLPKGKDGDIAQKTEDLVGPYELHDFFLYNLVRCHFRPAKIFFLAKTAFAGKYSDDIIKKWLKTFVRRFFNQQFKRSCLPDGPKVGSVSLSPRGDWRMPSDADSRRWVAEAENLA